MIKIEQISLLFYLFKWLIITLIVGALIGSVSALFLISPSLVTNYMKSHLWIVALLPIAGLLIGLMYHYWVGNVVKGNNYLIEEIHAPKDIILFKMAPLIYIGTVIVRIFVRSISQNDTLLI